MGDSIRGWWTALTLVCGLAVLGARPVMPGAFWRLPAEIRDQATVVVSGRFQVSRGPCEFLPDGSRRWPLLRGFELTAIHRGEVRSDYLGVGQPRLFGSDDADGAPVEGREYLLLLRPSDASLKSLRRREGSRHHLDALTAEEVVAIVAP